MGGHSREYLTELLLLRQLLYSSSEVLHLFMVLFSTSRPRELDLTHIDQLRQIVLPLIGIN